MKTLLLSSIMLFSLKAYTQEITIADYNRSQELFNEGRILLQNHDYLKAIDSFTKAIALNDNAADFFLSRAESLSKLMRYNEAIQDISIALDLSPNQSDMYFLAANIYFKQELYEKSTASYELAIKYAESSQLQVNLAHCYFNQGNAYLGLKDYPRAVSSFDKAIIEDGYFAEAFHNRGYAKLKLADKKGACSDFFKAKNAGTDKSNNYIEKFCR